MKRDEGRRPVSYVLLSCLLAFVLLIAGGGTDGVACSLGDGSCLPGTEPLGSYRIYLPLVIGGNASPPPPPACALEEEPNDVHDNGQVFLSRCVDGSASWDGDLDWYRLNVCSGPLTLILTLEGPEGTNLDLYLHEDPPGWPLYSSEGPGSNEVITATNVVTGTYYAQVAPFWGSQGDYILTIEVRR
jgi:hypothetical protein